mgnify:CR=1 FL=1
MKLCVDLAKELNIKVGDILVEYNGEPFVDILDYFYGESTAKLGKVDRFKSVVSNFKKAKRTRPDATSFEDAVSPERQAKVANLKEVPKPDDTADALAAAICHGHSADTRTRLKEVGLR